MPQNENEKQLAANQKYRETWRVLKDGKWVVEKRISKECGREALGNIERILNQQIELAGKLNADELRQIILFQEKEEKEKEIVYRRPYVEGETLAQKIENGPFKTLDAIGLILKIGQIVSVAHSKGIVHGDLKPENIMIAKDSSVCIIDWDTMKINRKIDDAQHVTMTQEESVGTPEYMDPEQCKGMQADKQSDVYALGLILYKMLAGRTPYTDMKPLEILDEKHSEIENIASQYPDLQIDLMLASAIEDALKKERNYRIQTVSEFLSRIDQCGREDAPVKPRTPSKREDTSSSVPFDDSPDKVPKYNFILIGHSGAGKTVLAAGLYSYAGESFAVEADSPQTRKNADNLKARLITHQWPDHTARGGSADFSFFIYKNQKNVASIRFPEYAGEDINQPRYCDDYLKNADAVALLLNPNIMEKDDHERIDRLSRLKECVRYLSRLPVVPPVAFLITASDRLETDLEDKKDEFEKYAKEIMVSLNANKVPAKRFDVSVTGKLEIQSEEGGKFKPVSEVSPINIDAPFIWLLDQLEKQEKKHTMRKHFKTIGIPVIVFAFVLLILLGVFFRRSTGQQGAVPPAEQPELTRQPAGTVTEATADASKKQPDIPVASVNMDHTREIEAIDPDNIAAVKSAVSTYKNDPNDKNALIAKVKEMIDKRFENRNEKYNKMNESDKNNWVKLSELLKKTVRHEGDSIAEKTFPECEKHLKERAKPCQKQIVDAFIANAERTNNMSSIVNDISKLSMEESSNPDFGRAEDWFFQKMYDSFSSIFDDPYQDESVYISMKELSSAIKNSGFQSESEKAKRWKTWCGEFTKWKNRNSQYEIIIKRLEAKVTYPDYTKPYFKSISITKNGAENLVEYKPTLAGWGECTFENDYKEFDSKSLSATEKVKLGERIHFQAFLYDQKGRDHQVDEFDFDFYPGIDSLDSLERPGNSSSSSVRLEMSVYPNDSEYPPFKEWKKDHPLPQ